MSETLQGEFLCDAFGSTSFETHRECSALKEPGQFAFDLFEPPAIRRPFLLQKSEHLRGAFQAGLCVLLNFQIYHLFDQFH